MEEQLQKKITKILFVLIMQEEMDSILEKENFIRDEDRSKLYPNMLEFFTKKNGDQELIMVRFLKDPTHQTSVFGTEMSFFATYISIQIYNPDLIINMGYAGDTGADGNLSLGTVGVAQGIARYHRREMLIEHTRKTNEGNYPIRSFDKLIKDLNYKSVKVGTSNSFVEFDDIAFKQGITLVEMELASIYRACIYFDKVAIGVKIVSDNADARADRQKSFLDSLLLLKETIYNTYKDLTQYLKGKSIADL